MKSVEGIYINKYSFNITDSAHTRNFHEGQAMNGFYVYLCRTSNSYVIKPFGLNTKDSIFHKLSKDMEKDIDRYPVYVIGRW